MEIITDEHSIIFQITINSKISYADVTAPSLISNKNTSIKIVSHDNLFPHIILDFWYLPSQYIHYAPFTILILLFQITQYSCDSPNLAPDGCTQYFADPTGTGTIQTFNFDGGQHLANQDQSICIRLEQLLNQDAI